MKEKNDDLFWANDLTKKNNKLMNKKDLVNHPPHYNKGIETTQYIKSWEMNWNQANVVKYVSRYNLKNTDPSFQLQDLQKAQWYLNDLIKDLKKVNDAGIKIHFIAGNHDYWDFGYLNKTANISFHKGDLEFSCNNKNVLITHGDGLLKNDYGYRFMKKIIRHSLFINLFKYIPPRISYKLAKKLSKSSSDYNHNDKFINTIISDITEFAENKWEKGIDIIMVGHYHQQKIITKNEKSLVFLGDWLSKFSVTTIIDEKIWQGNWEQFIKLS